MSNIKYLKCECGWSGNYLERYKDERYMHEETYRGCPECASRIHDGVELTNHEEGEE